MKHKTAVVTGAGSGVGQAVALALAAAGWRVALIGRRSAALRDTVRQAGRKSANLMPFPCDIGDAAAVAATAAKILKRFGPVEALVNAAGTNVPRRSLVELSRADYRAIMDANLDGAYNCVQGFLPAMRAQKSGTIVNVVSEAAKQASAKAGPAYVMSKFGLAGLTQAINAEERANGIRACAIFPGDIDTPLLDRRPNPPPAEARLKMLRSADVAACVLLAIQLPARAVVEEILVRPR
jgi:NAD(P)-dependent dehydrogenase (short-subunit alcohol dehydrogenase family)